MIKITNKNIIANYFGKFITGGLTFFLMPIFIKYLGVEAFGLIGFFISLNSILAIFDLGIGGALTREIARLSILSNSIKLQRNLLRTLELLYWGLSLVVFILLYFTSNYISKFWLNIHSLDYQTTNAVLKLMAIAISLNFPIALYQGGLIGLEKQILINKIQIFISLFKNIGSILLLWLYNSDILVYFQWQILSSFISLIFFYFSIWSLLPKKYGGGIFDIKILKQIWKYSAAISLSALLGIFLSQLDKLILSKTLSLENFGYYNVAVNFASSIWLLITPYNSAIFPKLVKLFESNDQNELRSYFHKYSQLLSLIIFPFCSIFIFFSFDLIFFWAGSVEIAEKTYMLGSIIVAGIMINGMVSLPANLAPASGWPQLITKSNIFQLIFISPILLLLIYFFNNVGAAIGSILLNSIYLFYLVPRFFNKILITEKLKWIEEDIFIPICLSFFTTGILKFFYLGEFNNFEKITFIIFAFLISFTSILIYFLRLKNEISLDFKLFFYKLWKY